MSSSNDIVDKWKPFPAPSKCSQTVVPNHITCTTWMHPFYVIFGFNFGELSRANTLFDYICNKEFQVWMNLCPCVLCVFLLFAVSECMSHGGGLICRSLFGWTCSCMAEESLTRKASLVCPCSSVWNSSCSYFI